MPVVYLNGQFLPEEQAMVPATDRGFVFGDGVYEVIPAYGGRLFRLEEHLERLQNSLDGVRIDNPHRVAVWRSILEALLKQNDAGESDYSLYLQVTRGSAKRDHAFPEKVIPTVFASASPILPTVEEIRINGIAAVTLADIRWLRCDIKAISLLPNILLRQQAVEAGAGEAILLRDGLLTEGAASNVFIVEQGRVLTPPKSPGLLPGITRDVVLELAQAHGVPWSEAVIGEAQLRSADEVWVTSSTREIVPVTQLDEQMVGSGRPGPVWELMYNYYQEFKRQLRTR